MKRTLSKVAVATAFLLAAGLANASSVLFTFDGYFDAYYTDSDGGYYCETSDATIELCVYFDELEYDEGSYWFFGTWDWWTLDADGEVQSISTPLTGGTEYASLYPVDVNDVDVLGGGLFYNGTAIENGFAGYAEVAAGEVGNPSWYYTFEIAGAIDQLLGLNNFLASETYSYQDGSYWEYYELLYCLELTNVEFCADCTPPSENVVPEPATMTLLGLGLGGLAVRRFRRRQVM